MWPAGRVGPIFRLGIAATIGDRGGPTLGLHCTYVTRKEELLEHRLRGIN
jgi:hypothetical protein